MSLERLDTCNSLAPSSNSDDDEDEVGGGDRLLGFMFGNVDDSGDLDIDYLDQDAKEHLAALSDKLGQSLTDINLSIKSAQTRDASNQDFVEKAEDAVDFEDIDEQYEGPETEAATEEDYLLPKKQFFSSVVSDASLGPTNDMFDDENYDDDEAEIGDRNAGVQTPLVSGERIENLIIDSCASKTLDDLTVEAVQVDKVTTDLSDFEEEPNVLKESYDSKSITPLPVLCMVDGVPILRFSEIFGIHEPFKKEYKRERMHYFPKEKRKSLNVSDIVEDDEEKFFKSSFQVFSAAMQAQDFRDGGRAMMTAESEVEDVFSRGPVEISHLADGWEDTCRSSQPMNKNVAIDLSVACQAPFSHEFLLLEQQDWEDSIIWDDSPSLSEHSVESCEALGVESESLLSREERTAAREQIQSLEDPIESVESNHCTFLGNSSVTVESFDSRSPGLTLSENNCHPQLLRLESRLELKDSNHSNVKDVAEEFRRRDGRTRLSKITLKNKDLLDGSWLEKIIWDPNKPVEKPKLIFDLQDEQMFFEVLDTMDAKHLRLHAGAMIASHSVKSGIHGVPSGGEFNIAKDTFYGNRKTSPQLLKSYSKKHTAFGVKVLHAEPAHKLQTMKTKLSNKDIANFHRPKALWFPHDNEVAMKEQGDLLTCGPMKVILKSLGGKVCRLNVDAEENISSVSTKASKKLDFKPSEIVRIFYSGKELEASKTLAEQNVRPNSLLHLVRTKIHLLPRAQKLPGVNKSLRPPGAFKKKSDLSVKDGHVFLMEYCEERPLLLGNIGMGARLCTYYQKSSPSDQTGSNLRNENNCLGTVVSIDPADKSPFIGEIKPGCTQSCLETNMYRAPIFQHKHSSTDFLLVRSAKGKLSIRRIDRIHVVGQQEPHMEVMSPTSKAVQNFTMKRLLVYMYREFNAAEKRGLLPRIRGDEVSVYFPDNSESILRKRLKHCADLQWTNGEPFWIMKPNFRIPLEGELRKTVTPESVCAYESMRAGIYRLKRLGILRLTHPSVLSMAMNLLPDEAITLAAASHIERELHITPWNLSCNFVACTNQGRENIERLEITGVGDPSGRGLGFSFVRTATKAPISTKMLEKKASVSRGGSTVTGTDADLRRLSMDAAREVLLKFNVSEKEIAKLTRWHRIALIRKLSNEQASSGVKVDPTTIGKYARGQRMSFLQFQQQTREKCQEIWDRQIQSLSAIDGEENQSDSEANSDLDSFAGDLENLLDAECEDDEVGNFYPKPDKADNVWGLKMRRHHLDAHIEEEIEDEATEAANLCRMLMDDDASDWKKKKRPKCVGEEGLSVGGSQAIFGFGNSEQIKKLVNVEKQATHKLLPQGSHTSKGFIVQDMKNVENFHSKKSLIRMPKGIKMTDTEQMSLFNKKVKIMEDPSKMIKERKSARESFVCGACGQLGHMKTNKHCPKFRYSKFRESMGTAHNRASDPEKTIGKSNFLDLSSPNPIQKGAIENSIENSETEKLALKAKSLPVKFKCRTPEEVSEKNTPENTPILATSQAETGNTPRTIFVVGKVSHSNKRRVDDESQKPSVVIRPPSDAEKEQPRKKIIIKHPKEISFQQINQDESVGMENRKTKKIVELSSFLNYGKQERNVFEDAKRRQREEMDRRRSAEIEEQENLDGLRRYRESIRREREEEERAKARRKQKKKRGEERGDVYLEDFGDRKEWMREGDINAKTWSPVESARYSDHAPPSKRRRGGEVGLANILEVIVEGLKDAQEISYLFLKPVTKKEAPDYLDIIKHPMDLSRIKDKVKKMEYRKRCEFRNDVSQIARNAHLYNHNRYPLIPPLADKLLELCDLLLLNHGHALNEAEDAIQQLIV